jgi:hypothetical protein
MTLQKVANLVGQPGGYKVEYCMMPFPKGGWNGLALPVASFRVDGLVAAPRRDPCGKEKWHISQQAMIWTMSDPRQDSVFQ